MPKVRVATLRPNFPLPAFQDEVNISQIRVDTFAEQAREAAAQGAKILYTPEMMFNFDPRSEFTREFQAVARETDAYIFITYTIAQEGEPWRNEAVLLTPEGQFLDVYGKNHAFGEPPSALRGVFPVYYTPLGRLATLICHDANYTDITRKLVASGAQITAAPIREFGGFGEQYWTNALFRAVENRTAMVVSGVATISAIINPDGSLVALNSDSAGSTMTLVGDVTLGSGPTLYTSLGDILGWVSLTGFVFFMVFQSVTERRARKAAKTSGSL
jgi:apolipoprotein N-acyltransferase